MLPQSYPSDPGALPHTAHIISSRKWFLDDLAPKLAVKGGGPGSSSSGNVWDIRYPGGRRSGLYLDAGGTVDTIESWAELRCRKVGYMKSSALPALWVSGLIKTGKSYTLREMVPAVLAETLNKQPPGHPLKGMAVLRLNGLDLERKEGGTALLYEMLQVVVDWAAEAGVPVEDAAWRKARKVLADGLNAPGLRTRAGRAFVELFAGFRVPVLVLLDELQALLQPTDARGELDLSGAAYIRDNVLRKILVDSPDTVLWAVTGSSMALAWMALVAMPVNGAAPLHQIWPVHLPSVFPPGLMQELVADEALQQQQVRELQRQDPDDVGRLLEWSGGSPALFVTMLERWECTPKPVDIDAFIADFMRNKMQEEVVKEWKLSLADLTDEQRSGVLDLASVATGAQVDDITDRGLWRFMQPHLLQTKRERYYLKDANQRQLLRAVIDRGGKLRTNWTDFGGGLTLVQLDWGWQLLQLGEVADYLLGLRPRHKGIIPERIDGVDQLTTLLQSLADMAAAARLPAAESDNLASCWEALGAFSQVLRSPYNTAARSWYESEGKAKKLESDLNFLVFFLRLSRNVLAHQKPWDGADVVDVEVVMALPRMVGMRVTELSEVVRAGMGALAPATVKEAEAAAAAEDGDGDGGGGPGDGGRGGDESRRATAAPAVRGRGTNMGSGLVSCTGTSRATALSSGARTTLSIAARGLVLPALARLRGVRITVASARQPPTFRFT